MTGNDVRGQCVYWESRLSYLPLQLLSLSATTESKTLAGQGSVEVI